MLTNHIKTQALKIPIRNSASITDKFGFLVIHELTFGLKQNVQLLVMVLELFLFNYFDNLMACGNFSYF